MKYPNIIEIRDAVKNANSVQTTIQMPGVDHYCVPARPLGFASVIYRAKAAWLVWTGRADALTWPGQ